MSYFRITNYDIYTSSVGRHGLVYPSTCFYDTSNFQSQRSMCELRMAMALNLITGYFIPCSYLPAVQYCSIVNIVNLFLQVI